MSNLKLVSSFLKIRFHNIGSLLLKTATTYAVGGFAAIQLSSIVVDNVSTEEVLGLTPESFMQLLFIAAKPPTAYVVAVFSSREPIL